MHAACFRVANNRQHYTWFHKCKNCSSVMSHQTPALTWIGKYTTYLFMCCIFYQQTFWGKFPSPHKSLLPVLCYLWLLQSIIWYFIVIFSIEIFSKTWYSRTKRNSSPEFPSFKVWNCFPLPLKVASHHLSSRGLKRPTQMSRVLYFISGNGWCQCWSVFSEHSKLLMFVDKSIVSKQSVGCNLS